MIVAGSASPLLLSSAGGYNLTKSLRFRSSASAYLNRTGSTATNAKLATYSFWFKRGILTTGQWIFTGGTTTTLIGFNGSSDALSVLGSDTSGEGNITTAVFRDPSAWYHVVIAIDTTQATTADRAKIYVNGVLQAVTVSNGGIGLNSNWGFNTAGSLTIGRYSPSPSSYTDGYLAEVNFVDGQALTPSSFGQTSTTTGVWIPKKYTGTYGTNGFYLPFTNTTSTSTLGNDFSGNSNTWTVNNISLTSGSTYDSMNDVPTLTSATTANYPTLNPLISISGWNYATLSNGNLTTVGNSASNNGVNFSTQTVKTGKWYAEFTCTGSSGSYPLIGITDINQLGTNGGAPGYTPNGVGYFASGVKSLNTSTSSYGNSFTTNDVIGIAIDADNGAVYFSKNGTFQNSGVPTSGSSKTGAAYTYTGGTIEFYLSVSPYQSGTGFNANFGQQPFTYTPPTGFVALNTFNLPTPTIGATASTTANKYFDVSLYTGNGSSVSVTNSGSMQPDLVWVKSRSTNYRNQLVDSVRGATNTLFSDSTDAAGTYQGVTAFNANGFSLGTELGANASGTTFVGWQWRANSGTNVTNTAGSITSTVSANTTAGFSIVTWTSPASGTATVGHGLGVAPAMIITKSRSSVGGWPVYHASIGNTNNLDLQTTAGSASSTFWNNTSPTSTVFTTGTPYAGSLNLLAYCFAQVAGYSAFGSYTGNGSTDGTFVYTGFRPRYVLIKGSSTATSWNIFDSSRNTYNLTDLDLYPNLSNAETVDQYGKVDLLSNGFKLRPASTTFGINQSGETYIYACFAEFPFRYANAR